jgi:hypothetical protein
LSAGILPLRAHFESMIQIDGVLDGDHSENANIGIAKRPMIKSRSAGYNKPQAQIATRSCVVNLQIHRTARHGPMAPVAACPHSQLPTLPI